MLCSIIQLSVMYSATYKCSQNTDWKNMPDNLELNNLRFVRTLKVHFDYISFILVEWQPLLHSTLRKHHQDYFATNAITGTFIWCILSSTICPLLVNCFARCIHLFVNLKAMCHKSVFIILLYALVVIDLILIWETILLLLRLWYRWTQAR